MSSNGVTARLMARMTDKPQTFGELVDGFDDSERKSASAILSQKTKAGYLARTGSGHNYLYTLAPVKSAKEVEETPATAAVTTAVAHQVTAAVTTAPAHLGTPATKPENPASGQCIDALSNLLRSELDPMTRDEIIDRMPKGYAPHQVVSAMNDAINAGWLTVQRIDGRLCYVLIDDAPETPAAPNKPDPLAAAFVPRSTRTRVAELQAELSALLEQQVGDHASPTVLHHIAAAGHHLHQLRSFID